MKFFASFVLAAAALANASVLVKRVDDRIPVDIPEGETLQTLCAEWKGGCLATVAIEQPGSQALIYCEQAPPALYPNAANVYCTISATVDYTDEVIGYLNLTTAS